MQVSPSLPTQSNTPLTGVQAAKAYDYAAQARRENEAQANTSAQQPAQPVNSTEEGSENRPIAGASLGSIINIKV